MGAMLAEEALGSKMPRPAAYGVLTKIEDEWAAEYHGFRITHVDSFLWLIGFHTQSLGCSTNRGFPFFTAALQAGNPPLYSE